MYCKNIEMWIIIVWVYCWFKIVYFYFYICFILFIFKNMDNLIEYGYLNYVIVFKENLMVYIFFNWLKFWYNFYECGE